jgi:hypothetical protein
MPVRMEEVADHDHERKLFRLPRAEQDLVEMQLKLSLEREAVAAGDNHGDQESSRRLGGPSPRRISTKRARGKLTPSERSRQSSR